MIVQEYNANINCNRPENYFERWYADVWWRRIGTRTAPPGVLERILDEELAKVGAYYHMTQRGYRYKVMFHNDADYTAFVLRWT
jgi:hypothetical protein